MSKLQAIQIDENTTIYVETTENPVMPEIAAPSTGEEVRREGAKGWGQVSRSAETQVAQSFRAIESTIKTYTKYTLNAFKDAALAEVEKVSLEFGVNVSGSGGVPYIAAGTMQCNIKVTVECAFPQRSLESNQPAAQQAAPATPPRLPQTAPQAVTQTAPQAVPQTVPQRSPQAAQVAQPAMPRPVGQSIG